jgi:hypothetical protein
VTDLERIGHLLAGWLQERRHDFPPLEVRNVALSVEVDDEGPVVRLTLVLHAGGDAGDWPLPAVAALSRAVRDVARREHGVGVELLFQDVRSADPD